MKRREAKSKGEKERYKHLNAEFQRIARRDKKAFVSDQCKEIEENNRMGCAQAWKPGSQHTGEKRGVAGLLLGRTERAARAAELQLCAQAR